MGYYIVAVVCLLFTSALFSCFETAIVAASRAKIHRLKGEGNKRAKILEDRNRKIEERKQALEERKAKLLEEKNKVE